MQRRFEDPATDLRADLSEAHHIVHVEIGQDPANALIEAALREQASVGAGGGGEAPRNLDPKFAQRADHLADGGILATDDLDVVHGHAFEWQDEFVHGIS